jgi:hypothetical protein
LTIPYSLKYFGNGLFATFRKHNQLELLKIQVINNTVNCTYSSEVVISSFNEEIFFLDSEPYSASLTWNENMSNEIGTEVQYVSESYMEEDRKALKKFPLETSRITIRTYVHVNYKEEYEKEIGKSVNR